MRAIRRTMRILQMMVLLLRLFRKGKERSAMALLHNLLANQNANPSPSGGHSTRTSNPPSEITSPYSSEH